MVLKLDRHLVAEVVTHPVGAAVVVQVDKNNVGVRWSRFTGQFRGKAKMDFKFDYAASFSSFSCVA